MNVIKASDTAGRSRMNTGTRTGFTQANTNPVFLPRLAK